MKAEDALEMSAAAETKTDDTLAAAEMNWWNADGAGDVEGAEAKDEEEEEDEVDWRKELLKLCFVAGIIAMLVVLSEEVGTFLLGTQAFLSQIPLSWGLIGITILSGPRRVVLPLYYIFPFSVVSLLYLVEKVGWVKAGLLYQCISLFDSFWFFGIRYFWSSFMKALADPTNKTSKHIIPRYLHHTLKTLDREWAHRIAPMDSEAFASIVLLAVAWATDEQITVYFICSRCDLTPAFFASSWTVSIIFRIPEYLVRARIVNIVAENFMAFKAMGRGLRDTPLWIIIIFSILALSSTLLVHAVHAQLIFEWSQGIDSTARRKQRETYPSPWKTFFRSIFLPQRQPQRRQPTLASSLL